MGVELAGGGEGSEMLSDEPVAERGFNHIRQQTRCLDLRNVRIWATLPFDPVRAIDDQSRRVADSFERFNRWSVRGDAFVIELADPCHGENRETLAIATALTLDRLGGFGPVLTYSGVAEPGQPVWKFRFARVVLSVAVFSPCLAPADPGDTFGLTSSFLLFQHELRPAEEATARPLPTRLHAARHLVRHAA